MSYMDNNYLYNIIVFVSILKIKGVNFINEYIQGKTHQVKRISKINGSISNHLDNLSKEPSYIIDNLYLGNAYNSNNIITIKKYGIEKIINVTKEIPNSFPEIEYLKINIRDTRDNFIEEYLDKTYKFILDNSKKMILIHCYMGSSRSAIIVVYYLVKRHNKTVDEAIEYIKNIRPLVNININFVNELKNMLLIK